jgi:hypothetical protein
MAPIYQCLRDTFFSERDLISAFEEDEILLSYVIPRVIASAGHQWRWLSGKCYFGQAWIGPEQASCAGGSVSSS